MGLFYNVRLYMGQRRTIAQIHPYARVASPDFNWGSFGGPIVSTNTTPLCL